MTRRLEVVVVEPYYGGSHRAWADGLARHSRHHVRLVTHPDEFWRWRMRGGAVTLAEAVRADIAESGPPDVVVASDMVDVATLVGLLRRDLAPTAPVAVYLHENQLVYPLGPDQRFDEGLALRNWTSLVVADAVWFNSEHHRDAFFPALQELLGRPPDQRHLHLVPGVRERSAVLPVGVEVAELVNRPRRDDGGGPPLVVWNQRWDHDKNPLAVSRALARLVDGGVELRLAVAGDSTRAAPGDLAWLADRLGDRLVHVGHLDRARYVEVLVAADVHVSAADHEFFGVAAVEAAAAGCVPVWPDRLSYPELLPDWARPHVLYPDGGLGAALTAVLSDVGSRRRSLEGLPGAMMRFDWSRVAPAYDRALDDLVSGG